MKLDQFNKSSTPCQIKPMTSNEISPSTVPVVLVTSLLLLLGAAVLSGFTLGLWPFFVKDSTLSAMNSMVAFALIQSAILIVFSMIFQIKDNENWFSIRSLVSSKENWATVIFSIALIYLLFKYCKVRYGSWSSGMNWTPIIMASVLSSIGLILLCIVTIRSNDSNRSLFLLVIYLGQIVTSIAIYSWNNPQDLDWKKTLGFAGVIVSTCLLFSGSSKKEVLTIKNDRLLDQEVIRQKIEEAKDQSLSTVTLPD